MAQIAVLGHGTVGSGVVALILKNGDSIAQRTGEFLSVKRILDLREFPDLPYSEKFTKDFDEILNDSDIKVVAEVMGGVNPAFEYVSACIKAGKSVVTSNKELVAAKGAGLLAAAAAKGVHFLFEASVGGGIPVIAPIRRNLAANEICEISGILNGTTNYILTKMQSCGLSFSEALKQAQSLGYAEANPAADVEGQDACRKICILASLAFGSHVYPEHVKAQGIVDITAADILYAQNAGRSVKLVARASRSDSGICVEVAPVMISGDNLFANVNDVYNIVSVRGDAVGDVVFYGQGAGRESTASAVVSDIIECLTLPADKKPRWIDSSGNNVVNSNKRTSRFYVRCKGGGSEIALIFGETKPLEREDQPLDEFAFITSETEYGELQNKLSQAREAGVQILGAIRVSDFD